MVTYKKSELPKFQIALSSQSSADTPAATVGSDHFILLTGYFAFFYSNLYNVVSQFLCIP